MLARIRDSTVTRAGSIIAAALALALGGVCALGVDRAASALDLRAPAVAGAEPPAATAKLPRHPVVLVVIDGAGARGLELPSVQTLAAVGARAVLHTEGPTFSQPQWVALLCGAPPLHSGVRS